MTMGISQNQHVAVCCHALAHLPDFWPIDVRPVSVVEEYNRLACNRLRWHRDPKVQPLPSAVEAELAAFGGVEVECGKGLGPLCVSPHSLRQCHADFCVHCCRRDLSMAGSV